MIPYQQQWEGKNSLLAERDRTRITDKHSALVSPTCSLQDYMLQQTMLRVKDPSDPKLLPCCSAFTFYSLGYEDKADTPADVKERTVWTFSRRATLELTHNWGTESDNLFVQRSDRFVCFSMLDLLWLSLLSRFHAGHIGIAVPDVYAACKLFEEQGVRFVKKPETGEFFSQVWPLFRIEILSPNNTFSLMSS
uniref:Glyoxalase I n=1 Tax=Maylandia zebra TaxID=106582 RepID=A0A3P9C803_9CICH